MSWPTVSLQQVASVKGGKRLPSGHDFSMLTTEHPYIRARDIGNNRITISEPVFITDHTFSRIKNYTVSEGDLVITIVGANIGDVGYISAEFDGANLTENAAKLHANRSLCDPMFLSAQLSTARAKEKFQALTGGSAQGKLGLYKIKSFEVVLPPLPVQTNIVSILSAYDDLIENNRRRIQLLEQAARLLYKEWFVHLRFPGHEHVKIKDGVPEGWEKKPLGDVIEIKKGKNITAETAVEGDVPVVAGGLTPAYFHNAANVVGPVITVSASGANAGFVNLYHENIWASDCSYVGADATDYICYFYLLLTSQQSEISMLQKGAAQPHVYPKDVMRMIVLCPPENFVKYFEQEVSKNFLLISNLIKQNKQLAKARDLLLPRLMNGELAV